jgi:hypothetical protein
MKGIDIQIESLRQTFEDNLWTGFIPTFYGRCMRNFREQMIPEVLVDASKDYHEVLLDDKKNAICFFDVDPKRTEQKATVNIYFAVKLTTIYNTINERAT